MIFRVEGTLGMDEVEKGTRTRTFRLSRVQSQACLGMDETGQVEDPRFRPFPFCLSWQLWCLQVYCACP